MEKGSPGTFDQSDSSERHLGYADGFKRLIQQNPGVIGKVIQLLAGDFAGGHIENDGIDITRIDRTNSSAEPTFPSFRVQKGEHAFFVKVNDATSSLLGGGGFDEFIDTQKAEEILSELPWVEVAEAQLGYKDSKHAYYVSRWNESFASSLKDYIEKLKKQISNDPDSSQSQELEVEDLESKIKLLKERLGEYYDVSPHNMAYDPDTKKIYILDLNRFPK